MTERQVRFHPNVVLELEDAVDWYEVRRPGLGTDFIGELEATIARALETPEAGSPEFPELSDRNVRRRRFRRFPYSIVYELTAELLIVVAVPHARRRPGYWRDRLG